MVLLSVFILIAVFLDITNGIAIQRGFIFNNCTGNNRYTFSAVSGGTLYWDESTAHASGSSSGHMNLTNIFDCVITFTGRPQGTYDGFEQFLTFYWRQWSFDPSAIARANEASLVDVKGLNQTLENITRICGSGCPTGCMIMISPNNGSNLTFCGANNLMETDFQYYYREDTIVWHIYMLGGYYVDDGNGTVTAIVNAPSVNIIIDYTSFYAGPCYRTDQYQCPRSGRCIDRDLYCDTYLATNCGSTKGDFDNCSGTTTTATEFPVWVIGAIIGGLLVLFIILLWCFWRPGYLLWRCSRLRNCPCGSGACCLCCSSPCTHGPCANIACCSLAPAAAGIGCCGGCCACCCCSCCGGGAAGGAGAGAGGGGGGCGGGCCGSGNNDDLLTGANIGVFKESYHPGFEWMSWSNDDGMHLRELR